jgi:colicin import membrane protein
MKAYAEAYKAKYYKPLDGVKITPWAMAKPPSKATLEAEEKKAAEKAAAAKKAAAEKAAAAKKAAA